MSKQRAQATKWETHLADLFEGERTDRPGDPGPADVTVATHAIPANRVTELVVLAWKRLVKSKGSKRRRPDGVRDVVVLELSDFHELWLDAGRPPLYIEAKASEYENVTRILAGAKVKRERFG